MNAADPSPSSSSDAAGLRVAKPLGLTAWIPWVFVATLSLVCIWLAQLYLTAQAECALLRDQQRFAELELRNAQQHAEAERILAQRELAQLRQQLAPR